MFRLTRNAAVWTALALFAAHGLTAPAAAQSSTDPSSLGYRLDRLERDLQDVQREVYSNYSRGDAVSSAPVDPAGAARLAVRITELEQQISTLTGQLEELNFRVMQVERNIEALSGDVDFRLSTTEQALGLGVIGAPPAEGTPPAAGGTPSPATSLPQTTGVTVGEQSFSTTVREAGQPQSLGQTPGGSQTLGTLPASSLPGDAAGLYDTGKSMLMAGDFANAEIAFQKFLAEHGDNELAGEAQYWLGEAYYVRGAYQEAGRAFAEGLSKYPSSPRGPDTLLKLGMSLSALNEVDAACQTYNELDRRYPDASQAIVQRVKVEKSKAGCI